MYFSSNFVYFCRELDRFRNGSIAEVRRLPVMETRQQHPPRSAVVATVMRAGLTSAVWSIIPSDRNPPVHAFLVTKGKATFGQSDAATLDLGAPALLWLPSGAKGVFQLDAGSEGFACTVAEDLVWRTLGDNPLLSNLRPFLDRIALASGDRLVDCLAELEVSFAALVREARGAEAGATAMMGFPSRLVAATPLASLCRSFEGRRQGHGSDHRAAVQQLVELHYRDDLGIADLAHLLSVTRTHLHEACVKVTGKTPLMLLHDRVVEEARQRLEQTHLSVEQVGYSLGFRDPGYFSRFFKRRPASRQGDIAREPSSLSRRLSLRPLRLGHSADDLAETGLIPRCGPKRRPRVGLRGGRTRSSRTAHGRAG